LGGIEPRRVPGRRLGPPARRINNPTVTDESEYTPYEEGHIPGALNFEWWDEVFTDETERDIVSKADFAERNGAAGIDADTTVVVYGGGRVPNWFALFGYWIYTYYGHDDVRVIDGGKGYWVDNDYPLSTEAPDFTSREYEARGPFESVRAYKDDIDKAIEEGFRWSTCARPRSSPARSSPRGAQRDGPARRPHPRREQRPDRDHPERTARSRAPTSSASCTRTPASTATSRRSPTAASASARRSSGSCSTSCSATTTFATTTARGPSGEPRRSADRDRRVSGVRVRATAPSFIRDHLGRSQLFIYRIVATSVRYPLPSSIAAVPAVTATGSECVPAENFDSATGSGRRKSALR